MIYFSDKTQIKKFSFREYFISVPKGYNLILNLISSDLFSHMINEFRLRKKNLNLSNIQQLYIDIV